MTTTAHRLGTPHRTRTARPLLSRVAAVGCSTLLAATALAAPAAATTTGSPAPEGSPSTSPTAAATPNQAPQLTCGGVMTQNGSTESIRVSVSDPDGDPVTLRADVSMFGVQPTVSGHVITYPAPAGATGQDNFAVLASDGRGGEAHCEIGVLVQPGAASPTPTPTPTPTPPPGPADPTPEPTSAAPTPVPVPEPTSEAPAPGDSPTPTPTSRPSSPDPTTAPATPGDGSDDETGTSPGATSPAPGAGDDADSGTGTPGGAVTPGDADGTSPGPERTGEGTDGEATAPDAGPTEGPTGGPVVVLPPRPDPEAGSGAPWAGVVPSELGAGSQRALDGAERLLDGLGTGQVPDRGGRTGAGGPQAGTPDSTASAAAEDRDAAADAVHVDRTAGTGASGWLFGGVGTLMIALVGLALMALPRGRRRH